MVWHFTIIDSWNPASYNRLGVCWVAYTRGSETHVYSDCPVSHITVQCTTTKLYERGRLYRAAGYTFSCSPNAGSVLAERIEELEGVSQ
jgi:hypothetical protein